MIENGRGHFLSAAVLYISSFRRTTAMRLAAKLILLFLSGLLLIVGLFSYLSYQREQRLAIAEHERYAAELARLTMQSQIDEQSQVAAPLPKTMIQIRRVEMRARDSRHMPRVPAERLTVTESIMTVTMPDGQGEPTLYTYVPIEEEDSVDPDAGDSRLEISMPDERARDSMGQLWRSTLLAVLGVAGLSSVVVLFGGLTMVARPLRELIDKVHRAADGDFTRDLNLDSKDELATLASAINEMCHKLGQQRDKIESETRARISAVEQLRHADRLRSVGRIAAGVAHEIGTPLNVVSGHAELITHEDLSPDAVRQSAAAIKSESDRIKLIISGLLEFARQSKPDRQRVDLRDVVSRTCQLIRSIANSSDVSIHVELPDSPVEADVDENQIQQVLTNLINNAIQAENTSNVWVSVATSGDHPADRCQVRVRDDGRGIAEDALEQIFEPFYTTKDVGQGTGLGLSISHGIVEEHGGTIRVESTPGRGATFTVMLPAGDGNPSAAPPTET